MRGKGLWLALLTMAGVAIVGGSADASAPVAVTCGAVIHTDAYLAADLTCSKTVFVYGNMTLDLRGHTLTGAANSQVVAVNGRGNGHIVIENGTITGPLLVPPNGHQTGSVSGVVYQVDSSEQSGSLHVQGVTFPNNFMAIDLESNSSGGYGAVTVDSSTFVDDLYGVAAFEWWPSPAVKVNSSTFTRVGVGVEAFDSAADVTSSSFTGLGNGMFCRNYPCSATSSTFDTTLIGIESLGAGTPITVTDSIFTGSNFGVAATDPQMDTGAILHVSGSTFSSNKTAIDASLSSGTISNNKFTGNGSAITSSGQHGTRLTVTSNTATNNTNAFVFRTTNGKGAALGHNTAMLNRGYGIFALGAVDLGGNRARQNSGGLCLGVICL